MLNKNIFDGVDLTPNVDLTPGKHPTPVDWTPLENASAKANAESAAVASQAAATAANSVRALASQPQADPAAQLRGLARQSPGAQLINAANANAEQAGSAPLPGAFGSLGSTTGRTGGAAW